MRSEKSYQFGPCVDRKDRLVERTPRRSCETCSNTTEVNDDGFDAIAFTLDLGLELLHFVPIEGVGDILGYNISFRC